MFILSFFLFFLEFDCWFRLKRKEFQFLFRFKFQLREYFQVLWVNLIECTFFQEFEGKFRLKILEYLLLTHFILLQLLYLPKYQSNLPVRLWIQDFYNYVLSGILKCWIWLHFIRFHNVSFRGCKPNWTSEFFFRCWFYGFLLVLSKFLLCYHLLPYYESNHLMSGYVRIFRILYQYFLD